MQQRFPQRAFFLETHCPVQRAGAGIGFNHVQPQPMRFVLGEGDLLHFFDRRPAVALPFFRDDNPLQQYIMAVIGAVR